MKTQSLLLASGLLLLLGASPAAADWPLRAAPIGHDRADYNAQRFAAVRSWNANYYNLNYGTPLALVVPPTATTHTRLSWGVAQSEVWPLYHQFGRNYPGPGGGAGGPYQPTPIWPSHTDQFGVYYIRGPWR